MARAPVDITLAVAGASRAPAKLVLHEVETRLRKTDLPDKTAKRRVVEPDEAASEAEPATDAKVATRKQESALRFERKAEASHRATPKQASDDRKHQAELVKKAAEEARRTRRDSGSSKHG